MTSTFTMSKYYLYSTKMLDTSMQDQSFWQMFLFLHLANFLAFAKPLNCENLKTSVVQEATSWY